MQLVDLKGSYDAIFSLGDLCLPAMQLEKNGLRPYAGVLDWMISIRLSDVNLLLKQRFHGFMELADLQVLGYAGQQLMVLDTNYSLISNHDFSIHKNSIFHLSAYPEVKAKYDRRITRFWEVLTTRQRVLFVRTGGTFQQVQQLQFVLSELVSYDFRILFIQHSNVTEMVETDCPFEKVCWIQLPNQEIWNANDHFWRNIFEGIHLC
ncbi:DUF1796 family putative cysteine peptidase [Paenibacillus alginolyticus]|uniref:Papain-like cysteine peptidase n=1 Tax=Paenibacillus alginolyticus TaxID=59839 RepID=A0ABT4GDX1_9BACL|nr:DUF1796 family putative cysteine peptidase [Paenibacillus alginolyticus]MCY9694369.1 papain-like cysteine peptidase [Paenibacillus alginolyticus]MEC0147538.1 DUF1796 family putative cysteine peptidase [Paenibacillus alginolyticus]